MADRLFEEFGKDQYGCPLFFPTRRNGGKPKGLKKINPSEKETEK